MILSPRLLICAAVLLAGCQSASSGGERGASGGSAGGTGGQSGQGGGSLGVGGQGGMPGSGGRGGMPGSGGRGGSPAGGGQGQGGAPGSGGQGVGGQGGKALKLPTANAPFDYQIGGAYPPPAGVAIVSRDRGDAPATGLYNICYVNGFQIQSGEEATWMSQHADLILVDGQGKPVVDPDWNEMLIDTSTAAKRDALLKVIGPWIDGCAAKGFDAVEIDNLDSYSRSKGLLTEDANVAFMAALSARAHAVGLAAGQKNAAELVPRATALGTDFAVVEECNRYDECDGFKTAYAARVFVIEYRRQDFDKGCANEPDLSIVLRDVDVSKPGSSKYVFDGC